MIILWRQVNFMLLASNKNVIIRRWKETKYGTVGKHLQEVSIV